MDESEDDLFEYSNELEDKNFSYNIIDDDEEEKKMNLILKMIVIVQDISC